MPVSNKDFYLEVDGTKYGFMLAEGDFGKAWNVGLAPALAPQQRLSADNLYEGAPPEVNVIFAAEKWTTGAGFNDAVVDGCACTRYFYSRGIDLSYDTRVYLSPARSTAALDGEPLEFLTTSLGTFCITENRIYEWDSGTSTWTSRDTSGSYVRGAVEHNSTIYVPRGTSNAYLYSTDGVTWTASTRTSNGNFATAFSTRGDDGESTPAYNVLVRIRGNAVSVTTDGTNGAAAWSTEDTIGPTNETVTALRPFDNLLFVFKKEGIYSFDFADVDDVWKSNYIKSDNGRYVYQWGNGKFYSNYGDQLLEFDPIENTLRYVYPLPDSDAPETKGAITGIGGTDNHLFITVQNADGNTYVMKGRPDEAWHTIAYPVSSSTSDETSNSQALYIAGPGSINTTNPVLLTGYGDGYARYILPRSNMRPEDDSNYVYETVSGASGAFVIGPLVNFGAEAYSKFLNRATILARNMSLGRTVTLSFDIDEADDYTELGTASSSGFTAFNIDGEVEFNRIRYKLVMSTTDSAESPIVVGMTLQASLNLPRFRSWQVVVDLSPQQRGNYGGRDNESNPDTLEAFLFTCTSRRATLYDRIGVEHAVRVTDLRNLGMGEYRSGSDRKDTLLYQVDMVAINAVGDNANTVSL